MNKITLHCNDQSEHVQLHATDVRCSLKLHRNVLDFQIFSETQVFGLPSEPDDKKDDEKNEV